MVANAVDIDLKQYDEILGALYDAPLHSDKWAIALQHFRDLFEANYVTLILRILDNDGSGLMIAIGEDLGLEGVARYITYPMAKTPFTNLTPDRVYTVDDLMSDSEWKRNAYYKEWCEGRNVYHVMGADISTQEGGRLRFRLTRPESAAKFSERDQALCRLFLPHLQRALNLHNLFDRSESLGTLYSQAINRLSVATIVLDKHGRILEKNQVAAGLLETNDGLKMVGGKLEAYYPSDNRELQEAIRHVFVQYGSDLPQVPQVLSMARPSGNVNLGVVIEPVASREWAEGRNQPAAMVYIRDAAGKSHTSVKAAKQLFNLTPAETALAIELANGFSLEEAAENLNIRRNTARAHLRSIFSKTGVRRQTELVRIILNSVAALSTEKHNKP